MGFWQDLAVLLRFRKRDANILVVGLDNSGKSTIINYLKPKHLAASQIVPTVGFHVDKIKNDRLNLTAFDMAGQSRYRSLWERYYVDCHGVIFVIDSCDSMRMAVASNELHLMIQHPEMVANRVPILILANKCDLPNAATIDQMKAELNLDKENSGGHQFHLEATSALTGQGLQSGIEWLSRLIIDNMSKNKRSLSSGR